MAAFRTKDISLRALATAMALFFVLHGGAQERDMSIRAGADRLTIGSFRDSYTSLGLNSALLELDFHTGTSSKGEGFAKAWNYPVFGIGLSYNTLSDVKFKSAHGHYSDMVTAYGVMSRDLVRTGHFSFGYDVSTGLSYSDSYYNPLDNGANWFFSSPVLIFVSGGGHLAWMPGSRIEFIADISVRHNSSARFAYPNGGLNYWGGGLSARYHFHGRKDLRGNVFTEPKVPAELYRRGWSLEVYAGGGVHKCAAEWNAAKKTMTKEEFASASLRKWPMASLSADLIYRAGGRFGLGLTVDGFYNSNTDRLKWSDEVVYGEEAVAESKGYAPLSLGGGLVQEVFYKEFALYVQEGLYAYRHMGIHGDHGRLYERAGVRYYPHSLAPFFFSACIKAHKFKADYLDFTVGIRLGRIKNQPH